MNHYRLLLRGCYVLLFVASSLLSASCTKEESLPWYLDTPRLWADYRVAVEDARTVTVDEICRTLPAITDPGDNPRMEWESDGERTFVLVGSMISPNEVGKWQQGDAFTLDDRLPWVTLPYDLQDRLHRMPRCADSLECRMRMIQLLGLPPDCDYDRMVFFYAERDRIFRPSPDAEIDDCEASTEFPATAPEHYRKWFAENTAFSYQSSTPYPWTRLGYTYDWHRDAATVVGPGEFIVHPGAQVRVKRIVSVWTWYKEICN